MTNTRITDAEIFERRYPVILRQFSLRPGSGGKGAHPGGDGVIRDIEFRIPVQVSILSERRIYHPYGMAGGEDGECGLNLWMRKVKKRVPKSEVGSADEENEEVVYRAINLGGKNTASMQPGERIVVYTPGGGGYGKVEEKGKLHEGVVQARAVVDHKLAWKGGSIAQREVTAESN